MKSPGVLDAKTEISILRFMSPRMDEKYQAYVYSKWLKSFRYGAAFMKMVPSRQYYESYHKLIETLLNKPNSFTRIAVLSDDHDVFLGFSVTRYYTLDYIYVHKDCREHGIATLLMPQNMKYVSHLTNTGSDIIRNNPNYKHLTYNPFT